MNKLRRPWAAWALLCLAAGWNPHEGWAVTNAPSLRERFAGRFLVGVALDGRLPDAYSTAEQELIARQFDALTPANCMKMMHVQRAEGRFDFELADAFMAFAARNKQKVCGHCLVWAKDERTPAWIFRDGDQPVTREKLLERMRAHIEAVAGRYRGRVISWDVVNEPLDDGKEYLRPSQWVALTGEEFMVQAFEHAHRVDPDAILVLNDYNIEQPAKRSKLLRLLKTLLDRKAPIHAVGIQGHFELDAIPWQDLEDTVVAIRNLGLQVMITELDIDVVLRSKWWADNGKHRAELAQYNPFAKGCPPEVLQRQAEQYRRLFELFCRYDKTITRVAFWDLHDGRSWLNDFPWRRANHPLLFDREARPKPAFEAVVRPDP